MSKTATLSLGTDSIRGLLFRYSVPAIIAMASSSLYNIIDSIFVGHGVGGAAIAGMAITMPIMNIATAFGAMVGVGAAARMSIRLGEGNRKAAENTLGNAVFLNLVIGLGVMAVMLTFLDEILLLFSGGKASEQTISYARDFMRIIMYGNLITHLYLGLNEQIRASGYPQRSMMVMLTAVVVNIILNPIFIFKFGWGIKGSALATVIAQSCALGLTIIHFASPKSFVRFHFRSLRPRKDIIFAILTIGLAPFILNICSCVIVAFTNNSLMTYAGEGIHDAVKACGELPREIVGDIYVGAFGIMNRVITLFLMIVLGLNQGMQPIVGYNYGARKFDRVRKTLLLTICVGMCVTTAGFLVAQFCPVSVSKLFVDGSGGVIEESMIRAASQGLKIILVMFPIVGFQIVTGNFFQYIGRARLSIIMSTTRQMVFLVPLLYIFPRMFGAVGVWMSSPTADLLSAILALVLLIRELRRMKKLDC